MVSTGKVSFLSLEDDVLVKVYKTSANQEALAVFYQRYAGLIYGTCMKYLKDVEKAADASADIYTELVEKLLKYEVDQPKAWLYMLTKNHCLQKLRKEKNHSESSFSEEFMQSPDDFNLEDMQQKETQLDRMHDCIEQLKLEQKQAITMFYLEKKCYQDIAQITGHAWNQVRSLIQNGRRNLKICLEKQDVGA